MAKLVVVSPPLAGRVFDVTEEKTSVGRLEDNKVCIPEASVSSHHCEMQAKGDDILIKDLGSTNGTFINGEQIKEATLKPGQALRLGTVELKFETGKRQMDQPRPAGVKIGDTAAAPAAKTDKNPAFAKKSNKVNKVFIGVGVVLVLAFVAFLFMAFSGVSR